jgi:tetratricopeptide (TPR) repeat protein
MKEWRKLWIACVVLCAASAPDDTSEVQPAIAKLVFLQDLADVPNGDLTQALDELRQRTRELREEMQLPEVSETNSDGHPRLPTSFIGPDEAKISEIRRNIELLKKIYAEKQRRKMEQEQKQQSQRDAAINNPSPSSAAELIAASEGQPVFEGSSSKSESPNDASFANQIPRKVFPRVVDPFELGNSLFMAGNIEQAVKFYQMVPADQISAFDKNWLELMKACCTRSQGRFDEAETAYRELARDKSGLRASEAAKEWLLYVNSRKRLAGLMDEYGKKADTVLKATEKFLEASKDGTANQ